MTNATHIWISENGRMLPVVRLPEDTTEAERERGEVACRVVGHDSHELRDYIVHEDSLVPIVG